jgi:hypothetical protein
MAPTPKTPKTPCTAASSRSRRTPNKNGSQETPTRQEIDDAPQVAQRRRPVARVQRAVPVHRGPQDATDLEDISEHDELNASRPVPEDGDLPTPYHSTAPRKPTKRSTKKKVSLGPEDATPNPGLLAPQQDLPEPPIQPARPHRTTSKASKAGCGVLIAVIVLFFAVIMYCMRIRSNNIGKNYYISKITRGTDEVTKVDR